MTLQIVEREVFTPADDSCMTEIIAKDLVRDHSRIRPKRVRPEEHQARRPCGPPGPCLWKGAAVASGHIGAAGREMALPNDPKVTDRLGEDGRTGLAKPVVEVTLPRAACEADI